MISVITPTVRPENLPIISKCLKRQDFTDWEWLVITPKKNFTVIEGMNMPCILLEDPKRALDDFYCLNKAWNLGFAKAKGELVVTIQDGIWFYPDLLSRFWGHFKNNEKSCVSAVGDQYEKQDDKGEPTNMVWQDPRDRSKFVEVQSSEMEMAVCSVPKQALIECGGLDEEYDKGPAVGEKEMCLRMSMLGYELYLDPLIEYKAIKHPRLTSDWDDKYWKVTAPMYQRHVHELMNGRRDLNVGCLMK